MQNRHKYRFSSTLLRQWSLRSMNESFWTNKVHLWVTFYLLSIYIYDNWHNNKKKQVINMENCVGLSLSREYHTSQGFRNVGFCRHRNRDSIWLEIVCEYLLTRQMKGKWYAFGTLSFVCSDWLTDRESLLIQFLCGHLSCIKVV